MSACHFLHVCAFVSPSVAIHRVSNMAPVHRNPGMAIVYSESPFQVPAVFKRLVENWGVHSLVVFVTIRQASSTDQVSLHSGFHKDAHGV